MLSGDRPDQYMITISCYLKVAGDLVLTLPAILIQLITGRISHFQIPT